MRPPSDHAGRRATFLPRDCAATPSDTERQLVQGILRDLPPEARDTVLDYYISLKTWPLALLLGETRQEQQRLFRLLADGVAGCSDGQTLLLSSPFSSTGENGDIIERIQGHLHTAAFLDMLAEATTPGNEGRAYFLGLEEVSLSDLQNSLHLYLQLLTGGEGVPPLPANLFLTLMIVAPPPEHLPIPLLEQAGVVYLPSLPLPQAPHRLCPPVGWQRLFLRSALRDTAQARRRLRHLGLAGQVEALLREVQGLAPAELSPSLAEGIVRYLANSFTTEGEGLFAPEPQENLRRAVGQLWLERLLPCGSGPLAPQGRQKELSACLEAVLPARPAHTQPPPSARMAAIPDDDSDIQAKEKVR